jgi:hypothetical protein
MEQMPETTEPDPTNILPTDNSTGTPVAPEAVEEIVEEESGGEAATGAADG